MIKKSIILVLGLSYALSANAQINIYTDRNAEFIDPVAEAFTAETGEPVNFIKISGADAIKRLLIEGDNSPADIVIFKDMLYLNGLASEGLLQPMTASTYHVPAQMQHPEALWAAITMRARTIVYNTNKVSADEVQTYASLGDEKWKNKLCLRTSDIENNSYNVGLVSGFIADLGEDAAKSILQSWMNNSPQIEQSDRDVLDAIENEECLVSVINSYYLGQNQFRDGKTPNVGIVFVEQDGLGAHVNGTGAGIVAASLKTELNNKFMELLLSSETQQSFSTLNYDFPVSQDVEALTPVLDWSFFKANEANWSVIGENVDAALRIFREVGYE